MLEKITVRIEGEEVKAVDGVPVDRYIEVRNYDVDFLFRRGFVAG